MPQIFHSLTGLTVMRDCSMQPTLSFVQQNHVIAPSHIAMADIVFFTDHTYEYLQQKTDVMK